MIYEGMSNYYDADKIARTTGNGTRQECGLPPDD